MLYVGIVRAAKGPGVSHPLRLSLCPRRAPGASASHEVYRIHEHSLQLVWVHRICIFSLIPLPFVKYDDGIMVVSWRCVCWYTNDTVDLWYIM